MLDVGQLFLVKMPKQCELLELVFKLILSKLNRTFYLWSWGSKDVQLNFMSYSLELD